MADPMGPLLDQDDEDAALFPLKEEGPQSPPLLSYSPSQALSPHELLFCPPHSSASPASSPLGRSVSLTEKAPAESLFMPWLSAGSLLDAEDGADDCKGERFALAVCSDLTRHTVNCHLISDEIHMCCSWHHTHHNAC